jgi:hypothetical protein
VLVQGIAQEFDQLVELLRSIGKDDAAAGVDHRPFGRQDQLQRLLDLTLVPL